MAPGSHPVSLLITTEGNLNHGNKPASMGNRSLRSNPASPSNMSSVAASARTRFRDVDRPKMARGGTWSSRRPGHQALGRGRGGQGEEEIEKLVETINGGIQDEGTDSRRRETGSLFVEELPPLPPAPPPSSPLLLRPPLRN